MKKTSWWKTNHLWDSLCASCEEGMSWLLRVKNAGLRLAKSLRGDKQTRKRSSVHLAFEGLEARCVMSTFAKGDLFIGGDTGFVGWSQGYSLNAGYVPDRSTHDMGMAFDASGNLYVTENNNGYIAKFSNSGTFLGNFESNINLVANSIVFDKTGNAFVGSAFGDYTLSKFNSSGTLVANYSAAVDQQGAGWIDLAADQHTIFYTSDGKEVKRFDVNTNMQLSDFTDSLPGTIANALRILPDGGVLVADTQYVVRTDAAGNIIQTYTGLPNLGTPNFIGLTLDPDGKSFWVGDAYGTNELYHIDLATGSILSDWTGTYDGGLAVYDIQQVSYPVNEPVIPIGEVNVGVNHGGLRLSQPLDFDASPGTSVGRNPALDYNSNTAAPDPVIQIPFATDSSHTALPTDIVATLTWNGNAQSAVTFNSYGTAAPGDTVVLALPVTSAISATGLYDWSVNVTAYYSSSSQTFRYNGNVPVVLDHGPLGNGWGIDGIDKLDLVSDADTSGAILQQGNGDIEFFTNSGGVYTSPTNDFGTLQASSSSFTYTNPNQTKENFNSSGYLTSVIDRDGLTTTYTYSGNELIGVMAPDGGTTTLNYSGGALASIIEPGGRTVIVNESSGNLTHITDADGTTRSLTYDSSSLLKTDQWSPYIAAFTYGTENNLAVVDLGLGTSYQIAAAELQGLTAVPLADEGVATVTDPLSHRTTYTLDSFGREIAMTTPDGATQSWARNSAGQVTQYTDALQNSTLYTYDNTSGDLLSENRPDGSFTDYYYDQTFHQVTQVTQSEASGVYEGSANYLNATGDVTQTIDSMNEITSYVWSGGLLQSMVDPRVKTTTYGYDSHRRLTSTIDPAGTTLYTYDAAGNPSSVIDARGKTSYTQYDALNRLTEAIDQLGDTTLSQYDAAGDLTASRDGQSNWTDYKYDQRGWETQVIEAAGATDALTTNNAYDVAGNLITSTDPSGKVVSYGYDLVNRQTSTTETLLTSPATLISTQTKYDLDGNATASIDALNQTTTYGYDKLGRETSVTDPLTHLTKTYYDLAGNVTKTIDPHSFATNYWYDSDNRLTKTGDPDNYFIQKLYDPDGNVTKEIDARGNTTTFVYDDADRLIKTIDPNSLTVQEAYNGDGEVSTNVDALGNTTTNVYDDADRLIQTTQTVVTPSGTQTYSTQTSYDKDGNVTQYIDADGATTLYGYDDKNQLTLTTQILVPGTSPVTYTDQKAYDKSGNVTQEVDARNVTTQYAYDNANRLTLTTQFLASGTVTDQKKYDNNGNVIQEIDARNATILSAYDSAGRLTQTLETVQTPTGPQTYTTLKSYDINGNLIQDVDARTLTTLYYYDSDNRLTGTYDSSAGIGTGEVLDQNGNVIQSVDANNQTTLYLYDGDNQLTETIDPDNFTTWKVYDANGNLAQDIDANGDTTLYAYDNENRLTETILPGTAGPTFTSWKHYDANGNVTQSIDARGNTTLYAYDTVNRLTLTTQLIAPATQNNPAVVYTTQTAYDQDGNVTLETDARNQPTSFAYDALNRLTWTSDPNQNTTQKAYDGDGNVILQTDARNQATTFAYDALNRLTLTSDPTGIGITRKAYDQNGNDTLDTDANGHTTQNKYDNDNRLIQTIDGDNYTTQIAYDQNGNKTQVIDARGKTTRYLYDAANRLTKTYDPLNNLTQQFYDQDGNLIETIDARNKTTQYFYDPLNRMTETIDSLNQTTWKGYDQNGNLIKDVDARGKSTVYHYDADNRLTLTTDPDNYATQTFYDANGNVIETIDALGKSTLYSYDADNRLTQTVDPDNYTTKKSYDADGNVLVATDARGKRTTYFYDANNRVTMTYYTSAVNETVEYYDPNGNVTVAYDRQAAATNYYYDSDNRLTMTLDPTGLSTQRAYDQAGNLILATDGRGKTTQYAYDNDNRLILTTDANGSTQQAYDQDGNLTMVIDPSHNTTLFGYDSDGRKTSMTDPLGHYATYGYDADGRMTTTTDRDSRRQALVYDDDGRLLTDTWYPVGSNTAVDTLTYSYDADGNMLSAGNNLASYSLSYDSDGRVISVTEPFGVGLTFAYDPAGNRTQVTDSFGGVETSTYSNFNMVTNRQFSQVGNSILQMAQSYNRDNQVVQQTRSGTGSPPVGVANSAYGLDNAGRVTSLLDTDPTGTTTLASYALTYDSAGNLSTQIDHGNTTTYTYDNAEQLTTAGSQSFSYDANGNRTNYTFNANYSSQLTYDGTWNYTYDNEGNETTKSKSGETWTYGYDNNNNMTSAVDTVGTTVAMSAIYKYDALGNRIETDVTQGGATTTTRFAYDGWNPAKSSATGNAKFDVLFELDGSNSLKTRNFLGDGVGQIFARMVYNGSSYVPYWYLTDPQGTIRDVIDNNATVRDKVTYGVFGNITAESTYDAYGNRDTTPNPALYRGRYGWDSYETDAETGLNYVHARYYDPLTARWMSQDPLGFDAGDSNLYRYVNNRPTVETDPSGLISDVDYALLAKMDASKRLQYFQQHSKDADAFYIKLFEKGLGYTKYTDASLAIPGVLIIGKITGDYTALEELYAKLAQDKLNQRVKAAQKAAQDFLKSITQGNRVVLPPGIVDGLKQIWALSLNSPVGPTYAESGVSFYVSTDGKNMIQLGPLIKGEVGVSHIPPPDTKPGSIGLGYAHTHPPRKGNFGVPLRAGPSAVDAALIIGDPLGRISFVYTGPQGYVYMIAPNKPYDPKNAEIQAFRYAIEWESNYKKLFTDFGGKYDFDTAVELASIQTINSGDYGISIWKGKGNELEKITK
jgi:RHS repeat-associated protein